LVTRKENHSPAGGRAVVLAIRKILHATDFSECSDRAFGVACALARDYAAPLVVLHVRAPLTAYELAADLPHGYIEGIHAQLDRIDAHDPHVHVERRLAEGDPAAQIVRVARESGCDLIVLGTHGRTGLGRLLVGSVAGQVVRRAPCPVLTVKAPLPAVPAEAPAGAAVGASP
jgi:nucleotide-binding universal stress UspA family protein